MLEEKEADRSRLSIKAAGLSGSLVAQQGPPQNIESKPKTHFLLIRQCTSTLRTLDETFPETTAILLLATWYLLYHRLEGRVGFPP